MLYVDDLTELCLSGVVVEDLRCTNCREALVGSLGPGGHVISGSCGACPKCGMLHNVREAEYPQEGGKYAVTPDGYWLTPSATQELSDWVVNARKWEAAYVENYVSNFQVEVLRKICSRFNEKRTDGVRLVVEVT